LVIIWFSQKGISKQLRVGLSSPSDSNMAYTKKCSTRLIVVLLIVEFHFWQPPLHLRTNIIYRTWTMILRMTILNLMLNWVLSCKSSLSQEIHFTKQVLVLNQECSCKSSLSQEIHFMRQVLVLNQAVCSCKSCSLSQGIHFTKQVLMLKQVCSYKTSLSQEIQVLKQVLSYYQNLCHSQETDTQYSYYPLHKSRIPAPTGSPLDLRIWNCYGPNLHTLHMHKALKMLPKQRWTKKNKQMKEDMREFNQLSWSTKKKTHLILNLRIKAGPTITNSPVGKQRLIINHWSCSIFLILHHGVVTLLEDWTHHLHHHHHHHCHHLPSHLWEGINLHVHQGKLR